MGLLFLAFSVSTTLFSVFLPAEASSSSSAEVYHYLYNTLPQPSPCICQAVVLPVCDLVGPSSVVLRGTILARQPETTTFVTSGTLDPIIPDPVIYTVDVTTFYKTDPTVRFGPQIEFVTGGAQCDVGLSVGEEYLLGLYWDSDGLLRVASCGLYRRWVLVSEDDIALLTSGCSNESVCDTCDEFQICVGLLTSPESYCADFCDPRRCSEGEICTLQDSLCLRGTPCPPVAVCVEDPCIGACDDTQECVEYAKNGNFFCSDTCEGACEEDETCRLRPRLFCRDDGFEGCPMKRQCL